MSAVVTARGALVGWASGTTSPGRRPIRSAGCILTGWKRTETSIGAPSSPLTTLRYAASRARRWDSVSTVAFGSPWSLGKIDANGRQIVATHSSEPTRMSNDATMTASEVVPAWANCGLYSIADISGLSVTMVSNAYLSSPSVRSISPFSSAVSISDSGRCGCGPPGPPNMWSMQAIAVLSENSRIAVPGSGSIENIATIVGLDRAEMYSSYVSCSIEISETWDTARRLVVSSVACWRANVSYAIWSVRTCSRDSLVGRRKSYGSGPVDFPRCRL